MHELLNKLWTRAAFLMGLSINHLRIHAFPPFALAVGHRLHAIVRDARERARGVALVANGKEFVPNPMRRPVVAHAESQPIGASGFLPRSHDVAFGTDVDAVPGLILRIPAIEIIVMSSQGD